MIKAVLVMNTQGKPRLAKFYEFQVPLSLSLQTLGINISIYRSLDVIFTLCFYVVVDQTVEKQQEAIRNVFSVLCSRPEHVSNFVDAESFFGPDSRLVYKHFATLYFVFIFDSSENELAMLDLIQVFVETLDKCFRNVCELDIVFNYSKMHTIVDEIILGGQVLETSSTEVMKAVEEISKCALLPICFLTRAFFFTF
ncbi:AP-3 complex subunit sigma [Spatholobus suberectus]|nr:AP-3 complex subunit sigma [Spatholobus suberectus]